MTQLTVSVLFASLLCLSFRSTRMAGVLGMTLLIFLHPVMAAVLLILGGAVFCFIHYLRRRN